VTAYDAVAVVAFACTDAIVPVKGAHVSLSVNEPVYPLCVTVSVVGAFELKATVAADGCSGAGVGVGVGVGLGVAVAVAGAAVPVAKGATLPPPPPPHAAQVTAHASAAKRMRRFT
jgi:hypothetical protein